MSSPIPSDHEASASAVHTEPTPSAEHTEHTQDDDFGATISPAVVETDVPDPFLVDDDDEIEPGQGGAQDNDDDGDGSDDENEESEDGHGDEDAPETLPTTLVSISDQVHDADTKQDDAKPPATTSESEDSEDDLEDEVPEIYLPQLISPTMFLPIPNSDHITSLLIKYVPQPEQRPARDLAGEWHKSQFHDLVMSNSWRALARMARDRLVSANPEGLGLILSLWYLRLSSLARLRLINQTSAECTNLFTVLRTVTDPEAREYLFEQLLPFELEVMHARLKYWSGDHVGYVDALYGLLKACKKRALKAMAVNRSKGSSGGKPDPATAEMWKERGSRMSLIIASQLVEMKESAAAVKLLEQLCVANSDAEHFSPLLHSALGRTYLQAGHIILARKHFAIAARKDGDQILRDTDAAFLACADGNWEKAEELLGRIIQADEKNLTARNNMAVALLAQGKVKQAIKTLEHGINSSPAVSCTAEPYLFNLATLYELESGSTMQKKRALLLQVAAWCRDGLKTTCLKMPTN